MVTLDGLPERLLISRLDDPPRADLGARHVARVARIERGLASAFLDLGDGLQALLSLTGEAKSVAEGAWIEVEIAAEARLGKLAQARLVASRPSGPPRRLEAAPTLEARLRALVPDAAVNGGQDAREAADEAEAAALAIIHPLPGGGDLAIEPTRALIAIDVDLGARSGDPGRAARQTNLAAIGEAARLLRLKGLGGLVVFDLVGRGHDGDALTQAARAAFAADGPGVTLGPVSRLGLFQLAIPHGARPLSEQLREPSGALTPATLALRLLRAIEREGRADGGARLIARCAPAVAQAAAVYAPALVDRLGPRFAIRAEPALDLASFEVTAS